MLRLLLTTNEYNPIRGTQSHNALSGGEIWSSFETDTVSCGSLGVSPRKK
ncbi:Hypothetical protein FKW44_015955 [Caligus rogercresseyi]|uniref:Uncharacterized protein n=1 Tax=Caligus rogercresseyi TaxID=217165 RepID=A0A7T8K104_CALRO|nr:Hypothetical protein FKW44_015955 [Caligus rogercresseyi]